ncbi:unnamed protein product [Closterium sp. Naga37s-1]|nr:unnamed protein product [Closterium sp. Naga37s-1]
MFHWLLLADVSPLLSRLPFADLLWPPVLVPRRTPSFRPPLCSLGDSLPPRGAFPLALPILPHVSIAAWAGRASSALPTFWCHAAATSLATVTRCLPSYCAAGGTRASAFPFRISPSAGGATRASGTRCYPSPLSASADPANAPRCCVPRAADHSAPVTTAPPRAFLPGASAAHVSATHPSICHRTHAAVLANAHRRRSSRSAPVAYHTGGSRLRSILHGADPSPACTTAPPSPCHAASAPVHLERPPLVSLTPGERSPRFFGCRLACASALVSLRGFSLTRSRCLVVAVISFIGLLDLQPQVVLIFFRTVPPCHFLCRILLQDPHSVIAAYVSSPSPGNWTN